MSWRGTLRRGLMYLTAAVAGFVIAYLIVAFFIFPSGVVMTELKVPNVVGLTYDDAARRVEQAGFTPERGEERFHSSAPKETVLEQTPPPGVRDVAGAKVTLAVSKGQQMGQVPIVTGMARDEAERAVENAGFTVGDVSEEPSNQPLGAVIGTRPAAGTSMPMPSPVSLIVSAGPTVVTTPDVVGRNFSEAQLLLAQVGLAMGDVSTPTGEAPAAGAMVIAQSPAAGSQVARGARIDLRLGSNP